MKIKAILITTTLAVAGWLAVASASPSGRPAVDGPQPPAGYQLAQNDYHHETQKAHPPVRYDWYQGQRGHWNKEGDHWRWQGVAGDQWYQGQRGHWYQEQNGWQFGSVGLICNNQGRNCRQGGYLPPNGEGMVSRTNPSMFWHCDSNGHNCNWARRPL